MIKVHTINGDPFYINADMIETMRVTPDTVLFLNNGKRILVKDTPDEVIQSIIEFRRHIFGQLYHPELLLQTEEHTE